MTDTASREALLTERANQTREIRRVTLWGLLVNLLLSIMKFVFGILGRSQALVADGVHSLSDSATDIVVLIGVKYWSAPADERHPHGHGRIETFVTIIIGATLGIVGIGLVYQALDALRTPPDIVPGWIVFVAACLSIVSKEILYRWNMRVGRATGSMALMANAWHHRSDSLSSVPVGLVVLGTRLNPSWTFLDPVAALIVSALILQAAWKVIWPAINQLLDEAASQKEREDLRSIIMSTEGVRDAHAIRTRHIGNGLQVDLHLQVEPTISVREGHDIAGYVKHRLLQEGPDVVDVLIHVEPYDPGECDAE